MKSINNQIEVIIYYVCITPTLNSFISGLLFAHSIDLEICSRAFAGSIISSTHKRDAAWRDELFSL
ncbi:MAG: hypothetical protein PVH88_05005 [Ignavibacteria bacterium]